ncbi:glycoside hydrolase [Teratosphaeria nubilosa]|uniref:glucan 1,3-beta-glucosidase n=1 Tax=Teratosphaeria nubilosa TaxID=161662 RepID=A0A6G1LDW6_9PEZI|nr:glycoside hydrolase [Teratosphaeria nubilosa]
MRSFHSFLPLAALLPTPASAQMRGVNLGGWLVSEAWITPSLYRHLPSDQSQDEWHLCAHLREHCWETLHRHWSDFYQYSDFQDIQTAGLNTVRIPLGYWAVDKYDWEPYAQGQFTLLSRAVQWAKQLNLNVLIDLHGAPASQNAQPNSGWAIAIDFMQNATNIDRTVRVLKNLTREFSNTTTYGATVIGIELLNEPIVTTAAMNIDNLKDFYHTAAQTVWDHQHSDADHIINVTIHDAFYDPSHWRNYSPNNSSATAPAESMTLDTHQYYAFQPPFADYNNEEIITAICHVSKLLKQPRSETGIPYTVVGEWSLAQGSATDSSQAHRQWLRLFFEAQAAAYTPNGPGQSGIGWIFWTWKTETDTFPWSYRLGIEDQYIPANISDASQLVYGVLENGCVDTNPAKGGADPKSGAAGNYTAPPKVKSGATRGVPGWEGRLWWVGVGVGLVGGVACWL